MRIYISMLAHFMMNMEFLQLDKEFEETVGFCNSMIANKIEQIDLLEEVYGNITDYSEKQALLFRLKQGAEYYEKLLELLCKLRQKSEDSSNGFVDLETPVAEENNFVEALSSRDPMDMLRLRYKQAYNNLPDIFNMKDLLEWFFGQDDNFKCFALEEIAHKLYDTQTPEEFKKAKNSVAAQLRNGAQEGRWQKIGRGYFAPNHYKVEYNNETNEDESADLRLETPEFTVDEHDGSSEDLISEESKVEDWDSIKF